MTFDYIFVLTYGRSGSTLLQGILNSIPGVLVRGENNASLRSLVRAWISLSIDGSRFGDTGSARSAWYGMGEWDRDQYGRDLAAAFVRNVLQPAADTSVIGFKEIRYFPPHFEPEMEMSFMRQFFPNCAFLVNTRSLNDVFASMERANHSTTRDQLERSDAMLRALLGPPDVFHVHYDDYVGQPDALRGLFAFLGAEFDAGNLGEVMAGRHSVLLPALD